MVVSEDPGKAAAAMQSREAPEFAERPIPLDTPNIVGLLAVPL